MNITRAFQEIDEIIVANVPQPTKSTLRNKLYILMEQVEAYVDEKEKVTLEHTQLAKDHLALKLAQAKEAPEFIPKDGVLWKRSASSFESHPYCAQCPRPTVMSPIHRARKFVCSDGHFAPMSATPPAA